MPSRAPQQAPPASTEAVYHDDDPPPPYTVLAESETAALLDNGNVGGGRNGTPAAEDYGVSPPRRPSGRRRAGARRRLLPLSNLLTVFLACILGTFLATCPIPRQSVPQLPRLALMTLCTSLVTLLSPSVSFRCCCCCCCCRRRIRRAGGRAIKKPIVARRLIVAYLGLCLSVYALFGLAEEVGFETSSVGAVVFGHRTAAVGLQPGYVARALMVVVGFALQRASGLFSTCRILATYLLLLVWVYADAPITILSLATGRKRW
ncbi:hypothetical protein PG993_006756 [Apiospora rasikravindrae]|uniref:CPBP family intramembrane metalloprotease n=1 Tax=Apiospora rasikravindrae TaxID=990691 RepID=A0ABR1T6L0_9PEZI